MIAPAHSALVRGATIAGLICGSAPLRAQPASEPARDGGEPARSGGEPARSGEPVRGGGEPARSEEPARDGGEPARSDGPPAAAASAPIAGPVSTTAGPNEPWSQGVSIEMRQVARALFLDGNRLFRTFLFAGAAEQYLAALSKWKHPAFYFNLALAQLSTGQAIEARESLERAVAYGAAPLGPEHFEEARRRLEALKRQLGRIHLICRTPGAEVTLDGATLFTGPGSYEGWLKAEPHELTAQKPGYQSEARRVTIPAGELLDLDLSLVTLSQATDASRRWARWKPWAVVAAGGAIAAAGGGLHALSARSFDIYDDRFILLPCSHSGGCKQGEIPEALDDRLNHARRQQAIAMGGYVAGGSLITAGLVLLYLNRPRLVERGSASAPSRNVTIAPSASEDMLGIAVSVSR